MKITLTTQQTTVGRLFLEGLSNPEIGARIGKSADASRKMLKRIMTKIDCQNFTAMQKKLRKHFESICYKCGGRLNKKKKCKNIRCADPNQVLRQHQK